MTPLPPFVRGLGALAASALAFPCAGEDEGVPRLLLGEDLQARPVRLVSIDARSVTYLDALGLQRTEGLDQLIGLLPPEPAERGAGAPARISPAPAGAAAAWVDLADGQRFTGLPLARPGDDAALEWNSADFGTISLPLEAVRRVVLRPVQVSAPPGARDALFLVNGDILEGFVESIGEPTTIERDSASVEVPLERIAEVRLGGARSEPSGVVVWLRSGTIAALADFRTDRQGRLFMTPSLLGIGPDGGSTTESQGWEVDLDDLQAAAFDASRLTPLASIPPIAQRGDADRRWAEPVRMGDPAGAVLGAADVELPGPMTVVWRLPEGAARLGGIAVLPEDSRTWGDCELVLSVRSGGRTREVFRAELSGTQPLAEFSVELPASEGGLELTATLEAGRYGAVQDRIILKRAVLVAAR